MSDPWAWKGCFYDTDYSFVAHVSTQGDQLIRILGPESSRQDGYQTEAVPGIGPVPGAKVKITRDESQKLTIYEIAIPRTSSRYLILEPAVADSDLSFTIPSRRPEVPSIGAMPGEFSTTGALVAPSLDLESRLPCQTFFGIEQ